MTQRERMAAGLPYFPGDPELEEARRRAKELCQRFNQVCLQDREEGRRLLEQLLSSMGREVQIEPVFWCDYGFHITAGEGLYVNHNCVILDCAPVTFGDHVLIGPNCGFYTAGHPMDAQTRNTGEEFAALNASYPDQMTEEEYAAYEEEWFQLILDTLEAKLPELGYLEPQTQVVQVTLDDDGLWGFNEQDFYNLDVLIIDYNF